MSLNEAEWGWMSIIQFSYDHLPQVQETSLVSYCIPVSYFILVSYCITASAYGLKAISDWLCNNLQNILKLWLYSWKIPRKFKKQMLNFKPKFIKSLYVLPWLYKMTSQTLLKWCHYSRNFTGNFALILWIEFPKY